jgi:DNA mismatch repair protein MutS2
MPPASGESGELLPMRNRTARAARPDDAEEERDDDEEGGSGGRPMTRAAAAAAAARKRGSSDAGAPSSLLTTLISPPCRACNDGAFPSPSTHPTAAARCRPGVGWAVLALMLVVAPITEHGWRVVPGWVAALLAAAGGAELARRILTFRRWGDEYPHVGRFCLWFAIMIAELLFENFMVWVVSATDVRKYDDVPALQDNVALLLDALKEETRAGGRAAPLWRALLEFRWAGTVHFLCAALALAFSVAWDQVPFSGFGMMSRFFAATVVGRLVRVAAFCATVLPNPRPGCYARRFPPPPGDAWGVLREGFKQLRGTGGCNDLVVSGHGAFWTTAPLMFGSYYGGGFGGGRGGGAGGGGGSRGGGGGRGAAASASNNNNNNNDDRQVHAMSVAVQAVLWACLAQTAVRDALEAFHYSVDMLLAVVVTCAAWAWTRRVYPPSASALRERAAGEPPDAFRWAVLAPIVVALLAGAVIIFVGGA